MDSGPFLGYELSTKPTSSNRKRQHTAPRQQQWTQMEEGEIGSESEQDPSILEVPAINWAKYVGVKSVQYIKMGHAPKVDAIEQNNWDVMSKVQGVCNDHL